MVTKGDRAFGRDVHVLLTGATEFIGGRLGPALVEAGHRVTALIRDVDPPLPVVYLALLIGWDVCYRIGTGWWVSVVAIWRSYRYRRRFTPAVANAYSRVDAWNVALAVAQLSLVSFVSDRPVLVVALLGHVAAVTIATGLSILLLRSKGETLTRT